MNILVQAVFAALFLGLLGLVFRGIKKAVSKTVNKKEIEIQQGLSYDFGQESLSEEVRVALMKILTRIAESDGIMSNKVLSVWYVIYQILGLNSLKEKTMEDLENKFDKYSDDEILEYLPDFNSVQKEWLVKAIIFIIESDQQVAQEKTNLIEQVLSKLGVTKEKYNEIKIKIE